MNKDSERLNGQEDSGLVISRTFGLPPSAIGITDNATYPNKGEEGRALTAHGAGPQAEVSHSTGKLDENARNPLKSRGQKISMAEGAGFAGDAVDSLRLLFLL
ncbi:hypothetical protein NS365_22035 [Aureimonas ureilytica]|uniref:Uncharacterized protein n=1 Tax=Aureimonas ureilytica TaxID=401562 RepID=A0A175RHS9_9HYPH|nr:hypothetical protein NS365_22035 [Aureimonas ureilytica]